MFFSLCGSLARTGIEDLTSFEHGTTAWVNFAGSLIMGMRTIFGPKLSLLHGMGFSGTISSLSTFLLTVFDDVTSPKNNWPSYGYGVPLFLAEIIIQIAVSFGGFKVGLDLAILAESYLPLHRLRSPRAERFYQLVMAFLGLLGWIAVLLLAILVPSQRELTLIACFSPFGTWLRYYLTRFNGPQYKYGTFTANISSTLLACMFRILRRPSISPSKLQRQVLYSLTRGFCACLSTVPMVIIEIRSLPLWKGYLYGLFTLFTCSCAVVVILGSYVWTR